MRIEFKDSFDEWCAFVTLPDTSCGFWCDPSVCVVERVCFVYEHDTLIAVLPFNYSADTIPFRLGLWRLGGMRGRMLKLIDYEFAISGSYKRIDIFNSVVVELKKMKSFDVVMADNWPEPESYARNVQATYLIDMPSSFEEWLRMLSSNTRQALRRRMRKLDGVCNEKLGVRSFSKEHEMDELLGYLGVIWKNSWHGRLGQQPPPSLEFMQNMARNGWLRFYILFVDDMPIASVQGYQYNRVFMDEAPAYDEDWKKYSPGLVLNYYILEDLFTVDVPLTVDFGFGYNQYKEMLGNRKEIRGQLWLKTSIKGWVIISVLRFIDFIFIVGKLLLGKGAFLRKVKMRIKNGG